MRLQILTSRRNSISALALLCGLVVASVVVVHAEEFYTKNSGVVNLDISSFDKFVNQKNQITLVEFYAPWCGHCKSLKPEWIKVAKQLQGIINVAAIDLNDQKNGAIAQKFDIKGFPTIKVFTGSGKPTDYQGARTASAIADFAKGLLPNKVKKVTKKTEKEFLATQEGQPHIILFTEKKSTPAMFKSLALRFSDKMVFGEIASTEKDLIQKYSIGKFPAILAVTSSGNTLYDGVVEALPIAKFLRRLTPGEGGNGGAPAAEDEAEDEALPELIDQSCFESLCVEKGGLCAVLVVAGKDKSGPSMEIATAVAQKRSDELFQFMWIDGQKQSAFLSEGFGINQQTYAQFFVVSPRKKRFASFVGPFNTEAISEFLEHILSGKIKTTPLNSAEMPKLAGEGKACAAKPKPKASEDRSSSSSSGSDSGSEPVAKSVVLTSSNFDKLVMKSKAVWIVEFYAPWCGHCKNLAPHWEQAAKEARGLVKFGMVDCTSEQSLASEYGISGYPTIKIFPAGFKRKSDVTDYSGARTSQAIVSHVMSLLHSRLVMVVTDDKKSEWIQSQPDLPHVLLISNKDKVPDLLKALSIEFDGRFSFGFARSTEEGIVGEFKADSFPALYIMAPLKTANPQTGQVNVVKYQGKLTYASIADQLSKVGTEAGANVEEEGAPVVHTLSSQADFERECLNKGGICMITLLAPSVMAANGEPKYEKVLDKLAETHVKKRAVRWMKVDRSKETKFFQAWDMSEDIPYGVVLLNPKKQLFTTYVGVFDEEHLSEFLEDVLSGRKKSGKINPIPKFQNEGVAKKPESGSCGGDDSGVCTKKDL